MKCDSCQYIKLCMHKSECERIENKLEAVEGNHICNKDVFKVYMECAKFKEGSFDRLEEVN